VKTRKVQLGDIVLSADPGFASGENPASGVVQLRMNNVSTDGAIDWSEIRRVPADSRKAEKYALAPGDVVFNNTNSPDLVGKTALFSGFKEPAVFSNHFLRVRVDREAANPGYVARWLNFQWKRRTFENLCTRWVNQASVRKDDLLDLPMSLPELSEQERIAACLEQADRLRRTRRFAVELTDAFLPAAFLEFFGELHENERKWPFEQLEVNAEIASGVAKGQKYKDSKTLEVPYVRVANVQDGYLDLSEIKTIRVPPPDVEALRLQPGDIVMTEGGDFDKLGRGAIWPGGITDCIHQNHIFRVRLNQSVLTPRFFDAFLRSGFAKSYFLRCSKQTTNLASINMTQLRATPIPLPPLNLQQEFATLMVRVERLRAAQREALRQTEHLFASLLNRAFSG
jgi:type I restriction enzyme S subunit